MSIRDGRKRATTLVALLVLLVAVATTVSACGGGDGSDGSTAAPEAGATDAETTEASGAEEMVIGYSNPLGSDVSLQSIGHGMEAAIADLGLPWSIDETDAKLSADTQVSDIDTMVTKQVGGITSWTLNSGAMEPVYARAQGAGIPVLGYNSESPSITTNIKTETDSTCAVADDQAKYIAERIPKAKLIMITGPEVPTITFTTECFEKAAEAEGLTILDAAADTSATEAGGRKVAETLLAKNKADVEAVWTFADHSGAGVSEAVKDAGIQIWTEEDPSGVVVISRDGAPIALENVERGLLTATWDGNFPQLGAAAIELLNEHFVEGVPLEELPKEVVIEATRYDGSNVGEYEPLLERKVTLPVS